MFVNAELTVLSCSVWVRLGLESPITQRKMQSLVTLATCNLSLSIVSTLLKRDYRMCYLMSMWVGNRKKKMSGVGLPQNTVRKKSSSCQLTGSFAL